MSQRADCVSARQIYTWRIKSNHAGFFFYQAGRFTDRTGKDICRNAGEVKFFAESENFEIIMKKKCTWNNWKVSAG